MSKRNTWHFRLCGSIVTAAILEVMAGCFSSADQDRRTERAEASKEASARAEPDEPASGPVVQPPLLVQSKVAVNRLADEQPIPPGPALAKGLMEVAGTGARSSAAAAGLEGPEPPRLLGPEPASGPLPAPPAPKPGSRSARVFDPAESGPSGLAAGGGDLGARSETAPQRGAPLSAPPAPEPGAGPAIRPPVGAPAQPPTGPDVSLATDPPRSPGAQPEQKGPPNPLRSEPEPGGRLVPVQPQAAPLTESGHDLAAELPGTPAPGPGPVAPAKPEPPGKTEIKLQPEAHGPDSDLPPLAGVPKTAKHSGIPFDPIKENGKFFDGWSKPNLALVITGRQDGYLEPCGCAGLDRMKGGMSRRYTMFQTLRAQGWPVVGLDVGGIAKGFGRQAELKFQIAVEAMRKTGYDAVGLGTADLQLPTELVLAEVGTVNNQPTAFVSANVGLFAFDEATLARTKIILAGGRKLGVTAILGKGYQKQINNATVKLIDPEPAIAAVLPILKQKADLLVLLACAPKDESLQLARKFPDFDLVVTAGGAEEPPAQAQEIRRSGHADGTRFVEVGEKGMYAVVLGVYDDPRQPVRYQRVTLDSRFAPSRQMSALMAAYQDQLQAAGLAGLGIQPLVHPLAETNGRFVGNEACKNCHEESYKVWRKTAHARAFSSLLQAKPPRQHDPECISCHVIGWNPQKFFPYQSGYLSQAPEKTPAPVRGQTKQQGPRLLNVGCEDCHGPGQKHADAEAGADKALQEKLRKAVRITEEEAADPTCRKQNCYTCHDLDNSPEFDFKLYFPLVEHHEEK